MSAAVAVDFGGTGGKTTEFAEKYHDLRRNCREALEHVNPKRARVYTLNRQTRKVHKKMSLRRKLLFKFLNEVGLRESSYAHLNSRDCKTVPTTKSTRGTRTFEVLYDKNQTYRNTEVSVGCSCLGDKESAAKNLCLVCNSADYIDNAEARADAIVDLMNTSLTLQ